MVTVTTTKMNQNVSDSISRIREFKNVIDAIRYAKEFCDKYELDNFDFDTLEAGGIGYDYRLTIA